MARKKQTYRNLYRDREMFGVNPDGTIRSLKQVIAENPDRNNVDDLTQDLTKMLELLNQARARRNASLG